MSLENISSIEGIEEGVNRSIQAKGAFSKLKDGIGYERFNHTGLKNIINEMTLMAIAMNLNTLTNKMFNMEYGPTRYEIAEEKVA